MILKVLLALSLISTTIEIASGATDKVVCYWGTWSGYRWGNGKFTVNNIDPNLCTHLIYGFVGINLDGTVRLLDEYLDVDTGNFLKFNALKEQNANLKTLIAIGGWNEGSENYSNMAANPTKRANLIRSALELVQKWGFDGFDLDWEYPNQRGGVEADISNFAVLIREFREEFDKHGLLVTAAVAAAAFSVDMSYDVPALSQYLDFINVMTYDLHGSWDEVTGQNAPLYASSVDVNEKQKQLNVDAAIRHWISRGADPQKLILGMGAYGRTYTLANSAANHLGAAITGGGNQGRYTGERGFVGYHEIIELHNAGGWTVVWDDEQKTPYTYKDNQWIGYDNPKSIAIKVEYAKSMNLGGVMVWSIDTDDFNGLSGTKNPLLRTINQALAGSIVEPEPQPTQAPEPQPTQAPEPEPTQAPEPQPTQAPEPQPTQAPEPETTQSDVATEAPSVDNPANLCVQEGFVRDLVDCSVFYYCYKSNNGFAVINRKCNHGLVYDVDQNICNYASVVQC